MFFFLQLLFLTLDPFPEICFLIYSVLPFNSIPGSPFFPGIDLFLRGKRDLQNLLLSLFKKKEEGTVAYYIKRILLEIKFYSN